MAVRQTWMVALAAHWIFGAAAGESGIGRPPPVVDGLALWLDAGREAASYNAKGTKVRPGGDLVSTWHDGSPAGVHLSQPETKRQPRLLRIDSTSSQSDAVSGWVVRFDGEDDFLAAAGPQRELRAFTLFVVAAPHSNRGFFRGLVSLSETGKKDYETGLNLDLGPAASASLADLNVEGRGFSGARNLLKTAVPFGTLQTIDVVGDPDRKVVRLAVDGVANGQRPLSAARFNADQIVLGARHFDNGSETIHCFLHGDVAEVLLYRRLLGEAELQAVRKHLLTKYAPLREALPRSLAAQAAAANLESLVPIADAPPVQMLVPGFRVRCVPLELTNINNLRCRADGKVYALAYGGDVWLLKDSDDDGLPDAKSLFFDNKGRLRGPIGMQVIPPRHALLRDAAGRFRSAARGVVVAAKGKVSALLDMDGDDRAEIERTIATGWPEIPQNVDAIGVAIHPDDGAIYFGLGTAAYNNAYLLDKSGQAAFRLDSEGGTIQRIAPDLSSRSTFCTGVRFTIGLEFNADKRLLATDQEGATWLANGNPFDELLEIRSGLHYGFPPRHPRHLPGVFDEPSLFDFGPQHQSTCGMAINLPMSPGGPIFGPETWRGDALVCGESRGKLYRTSLTKDRTGEYVARNQLIASLGNLTVDCCLTLRGDLLVACHSGGPDWGTGPSGIGKIFLVETERPGPPRPTSVWAAGPQEVRVAFDRPLNPQHLVKLAEQSKITCGEFVAAGDRFETIRPGYAVTQMQIAKPRYRLPIYSASVTPDRKTLLLATARHVAAVGYALTLPGMGRESASSGDRYLPQHPQIDLAYALNGVQANWQPRDKEQGLTAWQGWLPHLDWTVTRALTAGDSEMDRFWQAIERAGTLELTTTIDIRGLFSPALQPGSQLDYRPSEDKFVAERAIEISGPGMSPQRWSVDPETTTTLPIRLRLATGIGPIAPRPTWLARLADGRTRCGPIPLHRLLLPWALIGPATPSPTERSIPELAGANWGRGRQVFNSDEAGCAKCHLPDSRGNRIGPDLANLIHRDHASVRRDIVQPSFAINPDFIAYTATLDDGRVLTGAIRDDGKLLQIGDKDGKVTGVPRSAVVQLTPSSVSIMPDGIAEKLGNEKTRDLLAYLLNDPPRMPRDGPLPRPAPRSTAEVEAILSGSELLPKQSRLLRVLLVAGKKDHGPGEHDYPAWLAAWSQLLAAAPGVTVDTAMEWPRSEQIALADTIVFYQRGSWTAARAAAVDAHLAKGRGLVYLHWAVEGGLQAEDFARRIGLASDSQLIKFRHGPLDLKFAPGNDHPIGRNFRRVHFRDESYWRLSGNSARLRVLATGVEEKEARPLFWTVEHGRGRVFVSILGHYSWTFDDPMFRALLLRGIAWSMHESVDRFNELVAVGADLADGVGIR